MKRMTIRFDPVLHRKLKIMDIDGEIESIQDYVITLIEHDLIDHDLEAINWNKLINKQD